jgi:alpha-D-ribose 1-methylphosphonate 5-triphosphate diphosphatase
MSSGVDLSVGRAAGWTLGAAPADYVLGHVQAVLPDRVIDDARVVVRRGQIVAVEPHPPGSEADVDGAGLMCLPGLIDTHSDALERERAPRPTAYLPWDFALLSLEGRVRAAGITTVFHGAGFQQKANGNFQRTTLAAVQLCKTVDSRMSTAPPVDHRVLYRLDARSAEGAAALKEQLAVTDGVPLVSHEDHTPGQGQYADRAHMERYLVGADGLTPEQAKKRVDELIADRSQYLPVLERNLAWLGELARAGRIRLVGHDPDSPEAIEALRERGGSVAEFPTTVPTAQTARELGFPVVMGAPNVLRGVSHSGNVSARELIGLGLVTALASDYLPSGLLGAAFTIAKSGLLDLPTAVGLVTSGPAEVAGLTDRGRLVPGLRADLVLVEPGQDWPVTWAVLRALACCTRGPAEQPLGRADEASIFGWPRLVMEIRIEAVGARPAQHRCGLRILDVEDTSRGAVSEEVADRVQGELVGGPMAGRHVAAVVEQDLVQVVALGEAVKHHLDTCVELGGPVFDRVGGGADALGQFDRELVLQRDKQLILGAEVQVEQPF